MIVFAKEIEKRKETSRQARTSRGRIQGRKQTTAQNKRYYANTESRQQSYEEYPALAAYEKPGIAERVVGFFERVLGDTSFPAYTEPAFILDPLPAGDARPSMGRGWGGANRASDWRMLTRPLAKMAPRKDYLVDPRLSDMRPQSSEYQNDGAPSEPRLKTGYPGNQRDWEHPEIQGRVSATKVQLDKGRTPTYFSSYRKTAEAPYSRLFGSNDGPGLTAPERDYGYSQNAMVADPPVSKRKATAQPNSEVPKRYEEGVDQGREARHAGLGGSEHLYPERKYNVGG